MQDIYLASSDKDRNAADELFYKLLHCGIVCNRFYLNWQSRLFKRLHKSKIMMLIILITSESIRDPYIKTVIQYAKEKKIFYFIYHKGRIGDPIKENDRNSLIELLFLIHDSFIVVDSLHTIPNIYRIIQNIPLYDRNRLELIYETLFRDEGFLHNPFLIYRSNQSEQEQRLLCSSIMKPKKFTYTNSISDIDDIHFSVAAPAVAPRGSDFILSFFAYLAQYRPDVQQRIQEAYPHEIVRVQSEGPFEIIHGSKLRLSLSIRDLDVMEQYNWILWKGDISSTTFTVSVPGDTLPGRKTGRISISLEDFDIARIGFSIDIQDTSSESAILPIDLTVYRSAFASYSSKDLDQVLSRVQGMQIMAPWLTIYLDIDAIESGQYWKEELKKAIFEKDIFFLFWSENAANSEWVKREWRCALKTRGLDYITPVPLVDPEKVPPPPELSLKQFRDKWLNYLEWRKATTH